MPPLAKKKRLVWPWVVVLGATVATAAWRHRGASGYPLAALAPEALASPLWKVAPEALDGTTRDDLARLEGAAKRIDEAVERAREAAPLLERARVDDLDPEARRRIRDVWALFLDPLVELDLLKRRYAGWFGVDYVKHAPLHARAFALSHAALSSQVNAGLRFVDLVSKKTLAQTLFDEAVPELGVPKGSFTAMRNELASVRDQTFVPTGAEWYRLWIARHLSTEADRRFDEVVKQREALALSLLGPKAAQGSLENKMELLRSAAFHRWFPVQKELAEWAGDTRFVPESRRLIQDKQLGELRQRLAPGDIVVERRNWYLSNAGLPGFWPHAALHVGSADELAKTFDADDSVRAAFGTSFSEHFQAKRPAVWKALSAKDERGHPNRILEAVSEGVVAASLEHSLGADYVGALRPRLSRRQVAQAIDRAASYFGRPYDFNFDFATDDAVVCSELVLKAYEGKAGEAGLRVPFIVTAGRRTVPPTELVRLYANERAACDGGLCEGAQLEFVAFLDGREKSRSAEWGDAASFAQSATRPKWDLAQP
ncbi:MAG: hypothetical protein IPG50_27275 [Myxococcales bacterium]|nr:hypothetical protein [Myxococcales bacterium]